MKIASVSSLILLASASFFSQGALAALQTLPGSACVSSLGTQTSLYNVNGDTGLVRTGSSTGWLTCPIQRNLQVRKKLYVNLNHPTGRTTTCKVVRSNYSTGASSTSSASITGTGNVVINLSAATLGAAQAGDTFTISCNVAQGTILRGTSWEDN